MDSITHIVLGACVGEIIAGRRLGKKALWLGAVAQSLADADFIAALWSEPAENLLAHRGITHSFFFLIIITPLLAALLRRWQAGTSFRYTDWLLFIGAEGLVHLLIDSLNVYGTAWWEPFSHVRVAFNWLYVADPLFTLWTGAGFLLLLVLKRTSVYRKKVAGAALGITALYLAGVGYSKFHTRAEVARLLEKQAVSYKRFFTTPTPLNSWLWYVVAETDSGFYTGYRSVLDRSGTLPLEFVPQHREWLNAEPATPELRRLIRFSDGYYALIRRGDSLLFNDLRFGQLAGWHQPAAPFVFYYYLRPPGHNRLLVQRGRFAGWNRATLRSLWRRMRGLELTPPAGNKK